MKTGGIIDKYDLNVYLQATAMINQEAISMKATVLVDNIGYGNLQGEWGLSIYIEYEEKKILLDAGASGLFVKNAEKMKIDLKAVDYAVLSHAHYDHSDGMKDFFLINDKAKFYLREQAKENCYFRKWILKRYIGMPKGILQESGDRIEYISGDYKLTDGVMIIPHKTEGLSSVGKRENMYVREDSGWRADDFSHEQSLVFDTASGLVIFNSCCHGGAGKIIKEVSAAYPDKKVYALIGGFHLYNKSKQEVTELAKQIKDTGIEKIYTGHCTGKAYDILEQELGEHICKLRVGLTMEF